MHRVVEVLKKQLAKTCRRKFEIGYKNGGQKNKKNCNLQVAGRQPVYTDRLCHAASGQATIGHGLATGGGRRIGNRPRPAIATPPSVSPPFLLLPPIFFLKLCQILGTLVNSSLAPAQAHPR
jgi:hypothetical protein